MARSLARVSRLRATATLIGAIGFSVSLSVLGGCARAPSPLSPQVHGSIGTANRGLLTEGVELPDGGDGFRWLRHDDHHHGLPRFVHAIERAAGTVAAVRPGSMLSVGDISMARGGALMPHLSHRSGRDADLLLYLTTLDGAPVETPAFLPVAADGLAFDPKEKRFLRFDVEREWLLVKALLEDPEARVQWMFANRKVEAMLIDWARSRGESPELIVRAMDVMLEPHPGGAHDDHLHIRTECSVDEEAEGCLRTGPRRPWIEAADAELLRQRALAVPSDGDLALAILQPMRSKR